MNAEMEPIDLFNWNELWEVTGPFIIMAITAIVVGTICITVLTTMKKGLLKDISVVLSIVAIIGISLMALYISAEIWGM
ncbi:hypothetical protein [Halobacillus litoralis]|uniref:Uncharacterized protein n=1 Tax=Halobacillus litoralis TaxID=45668 RepID=A0A410MDL7_9BACI|nr:hypothetical protein [Halobacillus litoralis]QAS52821.1 hypothetical protein HLI_11745 [Halobacillus litoralis]